MKGNGIFIAVIFLIIGVLIGVLYVRSKNVCYNLPKDGTPDQWGPKYWASLHSTVEKIPCSLCRNEAIEMMRFIHDAVNKKLGKNLHYEENFHKWLNKFSDIKTQMEIKNV